MHSFFSPFGKLELSNHSIQDSLPLLAVLYIFQFTLKVWTLVEIKINQKAQAGPDLVKHLFILLIRLFTFHNHLCSKRYTLPLLKVRMTLHA